MKKLLVLLLLSGLSCILKAQTFPQRNHFLQPDFYTQTLDGAVLANGNLVVVCSAGNRYFFGSEYLWLACFGPDGSLVWSKPAQLGSERIWSAVIMPLPDSTFALQYQPSGCDFGQPESWAYFDAEGTRLWYSALEADWALPMWPYDAHSLVVGNPNGDFYRLQYAGQELGLVDILTNLPAYGQGYLKLSSGDFVMTSNLSRLHLLGEGLVPKKEKNFGKAIAAVDEIPGGTLAVLFSDSLYILNADLEPVQKVALLFTGKKMAVAGERIFVYAEKNGVRRLIELDTNLQIINQLQVPKDVANPNLSASDKDLILWGTSNWADQTPALFCQTIPGDSSGFDPLPDLAIVDITFPDTVRYTTVNWGPFFEWAIQFGKVVVTIKNEGSLPVESYQLNLKDFYCPGICPGELNFTTLISDIPLQPGEERDVEFASQLYYDCSDPLSEICIWVSGPNGAPDANPSNNRFCKKFIAYLGSEELNNQPSIAVYPNPSSGIIHLSGLEISTPYRLFNANGQWVKTGVADSETLDFSGLPKGLYLIQLEFPEKKFAYLRFLIAQP